MLCPLIKTTFYVHIGIVKFSSLFKESPCSPVVTFPSFVRKGMAFSPRRGTPFFYICVRLHLSFFVQSFFSIFQTKLCECEKTFLRKDIKPSWSWVIYIHLVLSVIFRVYFFELVSNIRRRAKERILSERFLSLFEEDLIKDFKKTLWL